MAFARRATALVFLAGLAQAHASVINFNPYFTNDASVSAPQGVTQLVYAAQADRLISMTSSNIQVTSAQGGGTLDEGAFQHFTGMSLAPSGQYLYAADFGGEVIGYGTPVNQSYVHQYNVNTGTWQAELSPIAYQIQATGDNSFVLASSDQWITVSSNTWSGALGTQQQSSISWSLYEGHIVYDASTQRLIHGSEGISSDELTVYRLVNGKFVAQETSGIYGSAQGHGGSLVLSSDGSSVYYGSLQVDALDVAHNTLLLPETIYAANDRYAFGNGDYYDAKTGVLLGKLGFATTVYAMGTHGDFWAYDSQGGAFRHFAAVPEASTFSMMGLGLLALCGLARSRRRDDTHTA